MRMRLVGFCLMFGGIKGMDTVASCFSGECREIKGCGSLKRDFYTKFMPEKCGFGAVTWWKRNIK